MLREMLVLTLSFGIMWLVIMFPKLNKKYRTMPYPKVKSEIFNGAATELQIAVNELYSQEYEIRELLLTNGIVDRDNRIEKTRIDEAINCVVSYRQSLEQVYTKANGKPSIMSTIN